MTSLPDSSMPLVLANAPARLEQLVAEAWPDCARGEGVDPAQVRVVVYSRGGGHALGYEATISHLTLPARVAAIDRALSRLADELEWRLLVVDREGGLRVLGWAAAEMWRHVSPSGIVVWQGPDRGERMMRGLRRERYLVALSDLDPVDPRRRAYEDAAFAAREERDRAAGVGMVGDAKRAHGEDVARMHAESWERDERARARRTR